MRQHPQATPTGAARSSGRGWHQIALVAIAIVAFAALLLAPAAGAAVTYTTEAAMPTGGSEPYGAADVSVDQSTGEIYAANKGNFGAGSSIARLSPTGTLLNSWQETPGYEVRGNAFDSASGTLYSLDVDTSVAPQAQRIRAYNENGTALARPGFPISPPIAPLYLNLVHPYSLDVDAKGQIYFANRSTTVTRFDGATGQPNLMIDCSDCPGASSFVAANSVATDSTGAIYVADARYDINEQQSIALSGEPTGGTFKLTFDGQTTADLPFDATASAVEGALNALSSIGGSGGSVTVGLESVGGINTYKVFFNGGTLAGTDVPEITADGSALTGGSPSFAVSTPTNGVTGGEERVVKFHSDGSFDSVLTEFPQTSSDTGDRRGFTLAVDPATDDVFVGSDEGSAFHIVGFDALGNEFADFGAGVIKANNGFTPSYNQMAVSSQTGKVYVSDEYEFSDEGASGGVLRVFAPDPSLSASTERALEVGPTTATVTGVVNPNGEATTSCKFEYGPTNAYGKSAPCESTPGSASIRTPVSADLSELDDEATYHYRVVESTGAGTVSGDDETFSTPTLPAPTPTTGAASAVAQTVATLNGTVNPQGGKTTCVFEYGKTNSYGASLPCSTQPGSGSSPVAVSVALSGLNPATTYHYRLKATNASGPTSGKDATLTTLADTCQTKAALCPPPPTPPGPPTSTPAPAPAPTPTPAPRPKPLKCKKGFKKVTKHGKARCVKRKAHKHKKH